MRGDVTDPLRNGDAVFGQEPTNLVGLCRPRLDEALAGTVQGQYGLLLAILDRNKTHRRPGHGLANRFRVRRIVLVRLDVGYSGPRFQDSGLSCALS